MPVASPFRTVFLFALSLLAAAASLEGESWRSSLYLEDWRPGFKDSAGRFLHDFSYAGYQRGEVPLPETVKGEVLDVTAAPFSADPSGQADATAAIQAALDAAAAKGGGVVYLPAGTYRILPPTDQKVALRVEGDNIVLRGAGVDKTLLVNDNYRMRNKIVIEVKAKNASWWYNDKPSAKGSPTKGDLPAGSRVIPVEDAGVFAVGDLVTVRNDPTEDFIKTLGMEGKWTTENLKNRALIFCRRVTAVDAGAGTITVDVPTFYDLKKADNARVLKLGGTMISEVGLEDFSLGMREHPGSGTGENEFEKEGTLAYDVHQSHAIVFSSAENCWMRRVNSFSPKGNATGIHLVSNGVKFARSRLVTIQDCAWGHAQYQGGGGNGYIYTFQGNDCLVRNSLAEKGRHNYDFATMAASGNVILDCVSKDGRLATDFHMYFSVANLIDNLTCDGDSIEAKYRPYGGTPVHGVTSSQSVFWNTKGLRYLSSPYEYDGKMHDRPRVIVDSSQFGEGYVIGTSGPASAVRGDDFQEGIGKGETLSPRSLYLDQLERRLRR